MDTRTDSRPDNLDGCLKWRAAQRGEFPLVRQAGFNNFPMMHVSGTQPDVIAVIVWTLARLFLGLLLGAVVAIEQRCVTRVKRDLLPTFVCQQVQEKERIGFDPAPPRHQETGLCFCAIP